MAEKPEKRRRPMPVPSKVLGSGRREGSAAENAFNEWLQRGLHNLYDDTASEPVPEELLRLIAQDREK